MGMLLLRVAPVIYRNSNVNPFQLTDEEQNLRDNKLHQNFMQTKGFSIGVQHSSFYSHSFSFKYNYSNTELPVK